MIRRTAAVLVFALVAAIGFPNAGRAQQGVRVTLDAYMRAAIEDATAEVQAIRSYRFREVETLRLLTVREVAPLQAMRKEFVWFPRDGYLIRSPVSVNGVEVSEEARAKAEAEWIESVDEQREEDRFGINSLYHWDSFMIRHEPGNYFMETPGVPPGESVVRVEYLPTRLFSEDDDGQGYSSKFDQSSHIKLDVLADTPQIVGFDFDNVSMEFLPVSWLIHVEDVSAAMDLAQVADGRWLPAEIRASARASIASADIDVEYRRVFSDYEPASDAADPAPASSAVSELSLPPAAETRAAVSISTIRIQGNVRYTDAELEVVTGVSVGGRMDAETPQRVRDNLLASGLIDTADVRRGYQRFDNPDEAALVAVVSDHVRFVDRLMLLPRLSFSDEYGTTLGALVSVRKVFGTEQKLSFPLSIGGRDTAGAEMLVEVDRAFPAFLRFGGWWWQQTNPAFDTTDRRVELWARGYGRYGGFQLDIDARWADVEFGAANEQQVDMLVMGRYDSRQDVGSARDSIYVSGSWAPLKILDGGEYFNRAGAEFRGYKGLVGKLTLASQVRFDLSDGELPDWEVFILGGAETLRGYTAGTFVGDNRAIGSLELRWPVANPLPIISIGVHGFYDIGTAWDHDESLRGSRFYNGVGFGGYVYATFIRLKLDIAYGLQSEDWHTTVSSGVRF